MHDNTDGARLCLFRGRAGAEIGGEAALGTDLSVTPPLHECGASWDVLRHDESKCIGDSVSVCDCETDAGSRKIEDSASPKQGTPTRTEASSLYPRRGAARRLL